MGLSSLLKAMLGKPPNPSILGGTDFTVPLAKGDLRRSEDLKTFQTASKA